VQADFGEALAKAGDFQGKRDPVHGSN
jgi:hypothetical protein